ncbi:MAG: hypothetical protein ACOCV7_05050 [Desulfonatronovibrionaceae bacterium]
METRPDEYQDQIRHWMDTICEETFSQDSRNPEDDSGSEKSGSK